ncbi:hypothetical protein PENSPDRAFT_109662 [Peniophora sp. CONT]|nr:hypothetical protein PENSPDRAFT_109662 [Peniophora sp. CONT]
MMTHPLTSDQALLRSSRIDSQTTNSDASARARHSLTADGVTTSVERHCSSGPLVDPDIFVYASSPRAKATQILRHNSVASDPSASTYPPWVRGRDVDPTRSVHSHGPALAAVRPRRRSEMRNGSRYARWGVPAGSGLRPPDRLNDGRQRAKERGQTVPHYRAVLIPILSIEQTTL